MSITKEDKQQLHQEYGMHSGDTGSAAVQIAVISRRISNLTEHLKQNKKDSSSKRGLYKLVAQRKKLLVYLNRVDPQKGAEIRQKLGIRG